MMEKPQQLDSTYEQTIAFLEKEYENPKEKADAIIDFLNEKKDGLSLGEVNRSLDVFFDTAKQLDREDQQKFVPQIAELLLSPKITGTGDKTMITKILEFIPDAGGSKDALAAVKGFADMVEKNQDLYSQKLDKAISGSRIGTALHFCMEPVKIEKEE